jgi:Acyclic terpene utilisation family protein AtuA
MTGITRVGCGSAGEPDRPSLALQMVLDGEVDYVCLDTLAERTLAGAQLRRARDPDTGYDIHLRARVGTVLAPAAASNIRIIGNMGSANPAAAARVLVEEAAAAKIEQLTMGVVYGDDILDAVRDGAIPIEFWNPADRLEDLLPDLVSANVYLGFEPILEALHAGADVIVTGRGVDIAPYMAVAFFDQGWDVEDLQMRARAAAIGHMLECGRCVTGTCYVEPAYGHFADDAANASNPLAEIQSDGSAVITKVPGTGGVVSRATCGEQLIHETGDPRRYLTPDVTLDTSQVTLEEVGPDRVRISGARGTAAPETLKVLVGVNEGWLVEGQVSFAGPGCVAKAREAGRIVEERVRSAGVEAIASNQGLIGVDSVMGAASPEPREEPFEVRLRVAWKVRDQESAAAATLECQDFWWAPGLGAGGVTTNVAPVLAMHSASVSRGLVESRVEVKTHQPYREAAHAAR